jgi:hypothetical protein
VQSPAPLGRASFSPLLSRCSRVASSAKVQAKHPPRPRLHPGASFSRMAERGPTGWADSLWTIYSVASIAPQWPDPDMDTP